jgi:secernin
MAFSHSIHCIDVVIFLRQYNRFSCSDKISEGMLMLAQRRGWLTKNASNELVFTFASSSPDFLFAFFGEGRQRMCRSYEILQKQKGQITVRTMMSITRDHWPHSSQGTLNYGITGQSICMHAGFGPIRKSQTTCSLVVHLRKDRTFTVWVTGTSAPCLSIYKPVLALHTLPHEFNDEPNHRRADSKSLWWIHERLHRTILVDYETRASVLSKERMELESLFLHEEELIRQQSDSAQRDWVYKCWEKALKEEEKWLQRVKTLPVKRQNAILYALAWTKNNKDVGLDDISMNFVIPWKNFLILFLFLILCVFFVRRER